MAGALRLSVISVPSFAGRTHVSDGAHGNLVELSPLDEVVLKNDTGFL
jgi:hypothetical protein